MAYRRRDTTGKRSSTYSSADFYRTLQSPTSPPTNPPSAPSSTDHGRSDSEEDIGVMLATAAAGPPAALYSPDPRPTVFSPPPTNEHTTLIQGDPSSPPPAVTRGRETERSSPERLGSNGYTSVPSSSGRQNSPLSPPRPFFLAESRRGSGYSNSDRSSTSLDPASDTELSQEPSNPTGNSTAAGRSIGRERSNTSPQPTTNANVAASARTLGQTRARSHHRRISTLDYDAMTHSPPTTPGSVTPFYDTAASSVYVSTPIHSPPAAEHGSMSNRPPPSAFLPFQSHPGNPDPGLSIPGTPRRASLESLGHANPRPLTSSGIYANATSYSTLRGSSEVGSMSQVSFEKPYPPFMDAAGRDGSVTPPNPNASQSNVYRNSAAAGLAGNETASIPRTSSAPQIAMRAPFLSPASRPTSFWSPPSYPYPSSIGSPPSLSYLPQNSTPPTSYTYVPKPTKTKSLMPSTRLSEKLTNEDKPWLATKPDGRVRLSYWLTVLCFIMGIAGGAVVCFFGFTGVKLLKDKDLCMVLNEEFNAGSLDTNTWNMDVELGGFGNGEFQMTTNDPANVHVTNGQLYITPTLTSDEIGRAKVIDGETYTLNGCTVKGNASACTAKSSLANHAVIPPVKSGRIDTKGHANIRFGKVEVKAKLPRGDWLWPAIWMLPEDDSIYGPWPMGGEMDIMEARGNSPSYPAQGIDFVRSTLNYGILDTLQTHIFGWWSSRRSPYDQDFHTYSMEWTPDWMRFYVDSRLQATVNMKMTGKGGKSFFDRGNYPKTADNGNGTDVVVQNIWVNGTNAAPFDQSFYLILDLAAGGTSGWFPDNVGGKPWFDTSATAMSDFAQAQDTWFATWAKDENDLAFRVDSVKMWKLGHC